MKRLLLITTILVFALVGNALAAGTVTQALTKVSSGDQVVRILTFSCTGDASNGSIPDTAITSNILQVLKGWYLYKVSIIGNHGGTEPTDDSDVYLYQAVGDTTKAVDILDGNGVDKLDDDVNYEVFPGIDGQAARMPVVDTLTLDVDNQSVHSATYTIQAIFVR